MRLLEQQWADPATPRILQVSGLSYAWQPERPPGERVDPADVRVGGEPLALDRPYSVVVNSFLAEGGNDFTVLREGTDRVGGPSDLDALVEYVARLPQPFTAPPGDRIQRR